MENKISNQSRLEKTAHIVDLASFRSKKTTDEKFARGRQPLYVSHLKGTISEQDSTLQAGEDLGDRLQNIRRSLDKINSLLGDLKDMSKQMPAKH